MTDEQHRTIIQELKRVSLLLCVLIGLVLGIAVRTHAQYPVLRADLQTYTTSPDPRCAGILPGDVTWIAPGWSCARTLDERVTVYTSTDSVFLLAYVGPLDPAINDPRVHVWTTSSMSPHVLDPAPWDQLGDYRASWPVWARPLRDRYEENVPGWVIVPVPRRKINMPTGSDSWIADQHMRVIVYVGRAECNVASCGARVVLPRTSVADVPMLPVMMRRREVAP